MPMTITRAILTKFNGSCDSDGKSFDAEFEVEFTGQYDSGAALALTSVEVEDWFTADLTIGAPRWDDGGDVQDDIYVRSRGIELDRLAGGDMPGVFRIKVRLGEPDGQLAENPLMRKDVLTLRRNPESKQAAYDAKGKLIATYRIEGDPENPDNYKPIEVFSNLPTVRGAKFTATITGYRDEYLVGLQDYDPDGPDRNDPENQREWNLVNDAPVTLDGLTFPVGTVCLVSAVASRQVINGYPVIAHTWELEIAPSFNLRVLNAGMYQWKDSAPAGKKLERIPAPSNGGFWPFPWPLNKAGEALPEGYKPADCTYVNFKMSKLINFDAFGWHF